MTLVHSDGAPVSAPRSSLLHICTAGFLAYGSYAICRTPLLPLYARDLVAGPALVGLVMGASTVTGIASTHACGQMIGRAPPVTPALMIAFTSAGVWM